MKILSWVKDLKRILLAGKINVYEVMFNHMKTSVKRENTILGIKQQTMPYWMPAVQENSMMSEVFWRKVPIPTARTETGGPA